MSANNSTNQTEMQQEIVVKKKNWKKYFWVILIGLLLSIVGLIYFYAQKPATGKVNFSTKKSDLSAQEIEVPEIFAGEYVTFMYPSQFLLKDHVLAKNSEDVVLETAYLTENGALSQKINLTIRKFFSQRLEDIPDYVLRKTSPQRYKEEVFSQDKLSGVSFVPADESNFEKTYFLSNNGYLAILAVSAPSPIDEELNKKADILAKSVKWKK